MLLRARRSLALALVVAVLLSSGNATSSLPPTTPLKFDVLVYDATSGGIAAAVSASRAGQTVALLCASWPSCFTVGGKRIGGMTTSGLGQTDIGDTYPYLGGIALEFYTRNWQHYAKRGQLLISESSACRLPSKSCNQTFNVEPHVARAIFHKMIEDEGNNITLFYEAQVISVIKDPGSNVILSINTMNGQTFAAKTFIDASYEGDLMAKSGVDFIVGRESSIEYNESFAGTRANSKSHQFNIPVDPFLRHPSTGKIFQALPHTQLPGNPMRPGSADARVQSYNFRLCVSQEMSVQFPKPANYNSSDWELLRRYLEACTSTTNGQNKLCQLGFPSCNTARIPNGKFDMNNCGPFSSDFIGGSSTYPLANYSERQLIWRKHLVYTQGLLYFMQSDPLSPAWVRHAMAPYGLCGDEFKDNRLAPNFPPGLYVRGARRLVGGKVFTQNTPREQRDAGGISNESIGIGGYNFDSHNARRLACKSVDVCYGRDNASNHPRGLMPGVAYTWNEGDIETNPGLYEIPYWVMVPKDTDSTNLLVVGSPSATHIGMSTLRMEPQYMVIGGAAGVAAAIIAETGVSAQNLNRAQLAQRLLDMGQILHQSQS